MTHLPVIYPLKELLLVKCITNVTMSVNCYEKLKIIPINVSNKWSRAAGEILNIFHYQ